MKAKVAIFVVGIKEKTLLHTTTRIKGGSLRAQSARVCHFLLCVSGRFASDEL